MHPTPLITEPGGTSRFLGWFRRLRRNVRERSIIAGNGIRLDHTSDGTRISIGQIRRAGGGVASGDIRQAVLAEDPLQTDDKLLVRFVGETEDKLIALPYLLRKTPFDGEERNGVEYTYTDQSGEISTTNRTATVPAQNYAEAQTIIPNYVEGDTIFCQYVGGSGTGVVGVDYIDMNLDARAWALVANYG